MYYSKQCQNKMRFLNHDLQPINALASTEEDGRGDPGHGPRRHQRQHDTQVRGHP